MPNSATVKLAISKAWDLENKPGRSSVNKTLSMIDSHRSQIANSEDGSVDSVLGRHKKVKQSIGDSVKLAVHPLIPSAISAGGSAAMLAIPHLSNLSGKKRTDKELETYTNDQANKMGIDSDMTLSTTEKARDSAYYSKDKHLSISNDASDDIIKHELGHAKFHQNHPIINKVTNVTKPLSSASTIGSGLYSLLAKKPSFAPAIANLALHSPTLIDEAAANVNSIKQTYKDEGLDSAIKSGLKASIPFGSYLIPAALPLAIAAAKRRVKLAMLPNQPPPEPQIQQEWKGRPKKMKDVTNVAGAMEHASSMLTPGGSSASTASGIE